MPTPTYAADSAELQAFNYVNRQRMNCGFGKLAQDPLLDKIARDHGLYTKTFAETPGATAWPGHTEIKGNPGFTGESPFARAVNAGYGPNVSENIAYANSYGYTDQQAGLLGSQSLAHTVYHTAVMFGPFRDVGFSRTPVKEAWYPQGSSYANLYIMNPGIKTGAYGQEPSDLVVTYPCEGSVEVDTIFADENPNPFVNEAWGPTGSPTPPVFLRSAPGTTIKLISFSLTEVNGPVAVGVPYFFTIDNDPHKLLKSNEAFAMLRPNGERNAPNLRKTELKDETFYQAQVTGTVDGKPFSKAFTFKTGTFDKLFDCKRAGTCS